MPLSRYNSAFGGAKGSAEKAHAAMAKEYGDKKGEEVFYATVNKKKPGIMRRKSYASGGVVEETGQAKVHKGEVIVPADHPARDAVEQMLNDADAGKTPTSAGDLTGYMARLRKKKAEEKK